MWMNAPWELPQSLQRPPPAGTLQIVAVDTKQDKGQAVTRRLYLERGTLGTSAGASFWPRLLPGIVRASRPTAKADAF
jgi:hypothetical protein